MILEVSPIENVYGIWELKGRKLQQGEKNIHTVQGKGENQQKT